jgi:hypothetical protein
LPPRMRLSSRFQPLSFPLLALVVQLILPDHLPSCCISFASMVLGGRQKLTSAFTIVWYHTHVRDPFLKLSHPVGDGTGTSALKQSGRRQCSRVGHNNKAGEYIFLPQIPQEGGNLYPTLYQLAIYQNTEGGGSSRLA